MMSPFAYRARVTLFAVSLLAAIMTIFACASFAETQKKKIVLVVNKQNPVNRLSRNDIYDMFLGKRRVWAAGGAILPCDLVDTGLDEKDSARSHFSQEYLGKDISDLKNYWIRIIFSGRGSPPVAFHRSRDVIEYVSRNRGAIGYLYEDDVTSEIKTIFSFDDTAP